jgi:hypothetical protein
MPNEITKTRALPKDLPVSGSIAEDEALRLQQQMAEEFGLSLSPVCDMDGNIVLVDENGDDVVEVYPDGTSVVCSGYPCSENETCGDKDISDMTAEELAAYILKLRETISASENTAENTQHSAAPFADTPKTYTDTLLSDPVVDVEPRTIPEPKRVESSAEASALDADPKGFEATAPAGAESGAGAPLVSTAPEGVILASGAMATGAIKIDFSTESAFPVAEKTCSAGTVAHSSTHPQDMTGAGERPVHVPTTASERNVPDIIVAGAEKAVSSEEGSRLGLAGTTSGAAGAVVVKDPDREDEKFHPRAIRSGSTGEHAPSASGNFVENAPAALSTASRSGRRSVSDPVTAGAHAVYDSNSDPFAIASAAADKGAPPFYNISAMAGTVSVIVSEGQDQGRVAAMHHRGDQGGRQGHDGDESGKGHGHDREDDGSEADDDAVSSVA